MPPADPLRQPGVRPPRPRRDVIARHALTAWALLALGRTRPAARPPAAPASEPAARLLRQVFPTALAIGVTGLAAVAGKAPPREGGGSGHNGASGRSRGGTS